MRRTNLYNTVRNLEDLISDLRAKRDRVESGEVPAVEWTDVDAQALAAAESAVGPIRSVAQK